MIANGGTINCSGKCHKINLAMGEYVMNSLMNDIPMGGVDVIVGTDANPGFNATIAHQQNPNYRPFQQHLRSR